MKRTRFARLAVLLCVAAMLVLQGCGGDSDDSAEQDLRAQVDMLMTERDAAVTAQAAAEAAQATAMTAQTAAEAAQATAEMERDTANTAKGAAEEAARVAQQAQMDAETAQMNAETAQMAADAMLSQANVDLAAAETAQMDAETAQMAAETRATAAAAAQMAAETAKMVAEAAQATAEAAATAAMTAQATAETAATAAMTAQAKAEMERDDALTALQAAQEAEGAKQNVINEATRKETNARAKAITTAVMEFYDYEFGVNAKGEPVDADGEPVENTVRMYNVPDEAPSALGVANTAAKGLVITPVQKPLEFEEYAPNANVAAPPAIDDFQENVMTRRNNRDDATQLIYSWTDIEEAEMAAFGAVHGLTVMMGPAIDAETAPPTGMIKLAKSSEFPSAPGTFQTYPDTDQAFVGTYDGVAGKFNCDATTCTVTRDADGELAVTVTGTGTLVFTPDQATDMVTVTDGAYLYFGFWLHQPDNQDHSHPFAAWAGGADLYVVNKPADLIPDDESPLIPAKIGRARYVGPAAGKYVTRTLAEATSKIGIFTATATLTADFEAPTATEVTAAADAELGSPARLAGQRGGAQEGTVNGTISDFIEDGESLGNWRVTLMPADLTPIGGAFAVDTNGDGEMDAPKTRFTAGTTARIGAVDISSSGQWEAQFFGNKRTDGDPNAIAGRFDVHNDHTTLSGAFGAYNIDD